MEDNYNSAYAPQEREVRDLRTTLIQDPKLYAEKILKSSCVTCSITIPVQFHTLQKTECVTTTIPFYMSSDIGLGTLSNTWSEMVDTNGENNFINLLNWVNAYNSNAQVTAQSEAMSSKVWKGSKFDGFTVDCLFISTRRKINPTKIIRLLAAAALPDKLRTDDETTSQAFNRAKEWFSNAIGVTANITNAVVGNVGTGIETFANIGVEEGSSDYKKIDTTGFQNTVSNLAEGAQNLTNDLGMVAPLYYGTRMGDTSKGERAIEPIDHTTLTLQIGEWFRASELLVESISGISFSKEIIAMDMGQNKNKAGDLYQYDRTNLGSDYWYPLWGKCTLKLIPFGMMHKTKYEEYFIDHSKDSAVDSLIGDALNQVQGVVNFGKNVVERFKL